MCSGSCSGLPLAFALGWLASRIDVRQWRRELQGSPRAYFKGLNLLLNEQQDKAIDAFIEAVQHDPDTSDLHFALGNLFRRRGEYERAVRVHQHLLNRADLPKSERERAQHALAQDFMKAGLFDRAEEAYRALDGTRVRHRGAAGAARPARALARLARGDRGRAGSSNAAAPGRSPSRIAHYWCELALEADAQQQPDEADAALAARAQGRAAGRPAAGCSPGQRAASRGDHAEALRLWAELMSAQPAAFNLVAADYAASAIAAGDGAAAAERLLALYRRTPTLDLLQALATLDADPTTRRARLRDHLRERPSLSAAQSLLADDGSALAAADIDAVGDALRSARTAAAALPLRRLRLRGRALLLAMPRLPRLGHLSAATTGGSPMSRKASATARPPEGGAAPPSELKAGRPVSLRTARRLPKRASSARTWTRLRSSRRVVQ